MSQVLVKVTTGQGGGRSGGGEGGEVLSWFKCAICNTLDLACILVISTSFAWIFSSNFKKNCH